MANIKKLTYADERVYMTSFHGTTVHASIRQICNALGIETPRYEMGDKTHYDVPLEIDGIVCTVYDWKEGDYITEDTPLFYHIGAHSAEESQKVGAILRSLGLDVN